MTCPSEMVQEWIEKGSAAVCPVIDMHSHPDRHAPIYFPVVEPADMVARLDRAGVVMVCGVTHESLLGDMRLGNDTTAELVAAHPANFRGYVGINPHQKESVAHELAVYDDRRGFIGFKFLPDYHEIKITDKANVPVFEFADERGLVILSHTWGHSEYNKPAYFGELAERYPNVTWLMGHAGYGEWEIAAQVARDHPNAYLEMTGAYCVAGIIDFFVERAGSEKILFGTDFPWFDPDYGVGCILFSRISDHDRRNILYNNARDILTRVGVDMDHRERL